ncbi:MAG: hypothetical protein RIQ52_2097 [Pseudomonadota bacterium]|jgi:protein TonB
MKKALAIALLVHGLILVAGSRWWPYAPHAALPAPEAVPSIRLQIARLPASELSPMAQATPVPEKKMQLPEPRHVVVPEKPLTREKKKSSRVPALQAPADVTVPEAPDVVHLADLGAQIAEIGQHYAVRPSSQPGQRMVHVRAIRRHRFQADAYERAWQQKVERIGMSNYPEQARRQHLTGSLLVSVAISPDGSLYSAQVKRSSGHPQLDAAALNIVHLAAPFAPLPVELREETDFLVITRTWKFLEGDRLETAP